MFIVLALAAAVPTAPLPSRISIVARVRILRASRINLRDPSRKPVEAIIRKGLIEFP
jgi:hypothetical protein